jgi:acyl-CoA thioesterase-1
MRRWLAALLLVALAGGPGSALAADRAIVALGDSLTAGFGLPRDQAYPALLQARLAREGYDYRVVNAGVSGDTTAGGLRRLDGLLRLAPEVMIVTLGVNDGLRGLPPASIRDNLRAIVARAGSAGARVLLVGMRVPPNYGAQYTRAFFSVFPEVAQATRVPLVPFLLECVAGERALNLADGIHPNAEGQRRIAEHLWPHLRALLAKPGTPRGVSR